MCAEAKSSFPTGYEARPPRAPGSTVYHPHSFHRDQRYRPADVLDAACAQHDYCIERSRYNNNSTLLYPVGMVEENGAVRCGIPLGSNTDPRYGCQVAVLWPPGAPCIPWSTGCPAHSGTVVDPNRVPFFIGMHNSTHKCTRDRR